MNHPTTRLLTVLELLQSHPGLSGADLATRLEVDRRTLRRYIEMLQDMGIPIEGERGRYGGYRLRPGFRLPPLMFNEEEALALTLGMLTVRQFGLSATPVAVEGVLAKLNRVLPEPLQKQVQALEDSVTFYPLAPAQPPASNILLLLSQASHQHRRICLRYYSRDEESKRTFDPYGLVCQAGRWYVVGFCHLRLDVRIFRLDRIVKVSWQDETFTPPPDFDCAEFVIKTLATTPYQWSIEVVLDTTLAEARRRVPSILGILEETSEGVLLRIQAERLDGAALFLVGLGCPLRVRQPTELREALKQLAHKINSWTDH
jgi:predicted DNA-binding transcriptional regulator YafY